jgi:hypothetical protein
VKRPPRLVAAGIAGKLFRLVPYRHRLRAALAIGRLLPFAQRYRAAFENADDASARVLLRTLAYANVKFPNDAELRGAEDLKAPAVIVTAHMFLNALLLRALVERGHTLAIIRTFPADPPYLAGSDIPLENLLISPTIFVKLRKRLADGEIAFISVDDAKPTPWKASHGQHLSSAAVEFAQRLGVPVFFAATRMIGGRPVAMLHRPRGTTIEQVMEELQAFLTVAEPR